MRDCCRQSSCPEYKDTDPVDAGKDENRLVLSKVLVCDDGTQNSYEECQRITSEQIRSTYA